MAGFDLYDVTGGMTPEEIGRSSAGGSGLSQNVKRSRSNSDYILSSASALSRSISSTRFEEDWGDLVDWDALGAVGVQVSGGDLYSTGSGGGASGINHWIGSGESGKYRAVFKVNPQISGGTSGGIIIGFSSADEGVGPANAGGDAFGLYLRLGFNSAQKVLNGSFTDIDDDSADYDKTSTYTVTMCVDDYYMSIVAVNDSDSTEIRVREPRAGFEVNNIYLFNSDSQALNGVSIGSLYGVDSISSTTAVAESYKTTHWSGDGTNSFRMFLPSSFNSGVPLKVVIAFHGATSNENTWQTNTNGRVVKDALVGAGYAVLGCSYNNSYVTWGADESLDAYIEAFKWMISNYPVSGIAFYANSMGGIESLLSIDRGYYPFVSCLVATSSTASLRDNYDSGLATGAINSIYGIGGSVTYEEATAGHDPILLGVDSFRNVPLKFITATDDTVVSADDNSIAFSEKVSKSNDVFLTETTGGHSFNFAPFTGEIIDFYIDHF